MRRFGISNYLGIVLAHWRNYLRILYIVVLTGCMWHCTPAKGQAVDDWTLNAPPSSVNLVNVGPAPNPGALQFTLRNISQGNIIILQAMAPNGDRKTALPFEIGREIAPGSEQTFYFAENDFSISNQVIRLLNISAIVYADGRRVGAQQRLQEIEDEMVGIAIETKRNCNILAVSPADIAGLDPAAMAIGRDPPSTREQAAQEVRGLVLAGVPQAFIDNHVNHPSGAFRRGVYFEHQLPLLDIDRAKSSAALPLSGGAAYQAFVEHERQFAVSDLAKKYCGISALQRDELKAILGVADEGNLKPGDRRKPGGNLGNLGSDGRFPQDSDLSDKKSRTASRPRPVSRARAQCFR